MRLFSPVIPGVLLIHRLMKLHQLDLSGCAGKTISLTLRVDALGNGRYDGSSWVRPQMEVSGETPG